MYLNGIEIFRDENLPAGAAFNTFATETGDENGVTRFAINPDFLLNGTNLIAVEVHQVDNSSSDVSFELGLTAFVDPIPEPSTGALALMAGVVLLRRRR